MRKNNLVKISENQNAMGITQVVTILAKKDSFPATHQLFPPQIEDMAT